MKKLLVIITALIIVIAGAGFYWSQKDSPTIVDKMPIETENSLIKTFLDDKTGITFEYPDQLLTKYINAVAWPPKVQEIERPFVCLDSGEEIMGAGKTAKQIINGRDYCVTKLSEGAAGSTYTTYTYAFPYNNTTMTLDFTLRSVQCGNYDDPKKSECEQERSTFNPDKTLDQIAQSLTFKIQ